MGGQDKGPSHMGLWRLIQAWRATAGVFCVLVADTSYLDGVRQAPARETQCLLFSDQGQGTEYLA